MLSDTEIKIKEAARKVFKQKGFAAARTRDIAEEAGVNLALLNYYFKGKKQLFDIIMFETIFSFKNTIVEFLNDDSLDFMQNLQRLVDSYTQLFLEEPTLPMFVLSELQNNQQEIVQKIDPMGLIKGSAFEKQMRNLLGDSQVDTSQIFMNIISMVLFPFVGKPIIQSFCGYEDADFLKIIDERRALIPIWILNMIQSSYKK